MILAVFLSMDSVAESSDSSSLEVLQAAVVRAAVTCYALEGEYPPDVEYLEENYGVSIDHDKYFVHYKLDGSNIRPDIVVYQKSVE